EERLPGVPHRRTPHARCEGNQALPKLARLGVTAHVTVRPGRVGKKPWIARIQLNGALEVPDRLRPAAMTTIDQSGNPIYLSIVWERAPGEFKFGASAIVIEKAPIGIHGQSEVYFSSIGLDADSILDSRIGQLTTCWSVIVPKEDLEMQKAEFAISESEMRIARDRLLQ